MWFCCWGVFKIGWYHQGKCTTFSKRFGLLSRKVQTLYCPWKTRKLAQRRRTTWRRQKIGSNSIKETAQNIPKDESNIAETGIAKHPSTLHIVKITQKITKYIITHIHINTVDIADKHPLFPHNKKTKTKNWHNLSYILPLHSLEKPPHQLTSI